MSKFIPYSVTTTSGNQFEFELNLHPQTESAVNVSNLLTSVLDTVSREIEQIGPVGNGDVLQALAMALAVRTHMLEGDRDMLDQLALQLAQTALDSHHKPLDGNLPPSSPRH